jgi:hypothetical protein
MGRSPKCLAANRHAATRWRSENIIFSRAQRGLVKESSALFARRSIAYVRFIKHPLIADPLGCSFRKPRELLTL